MSKKVLFYMGLDLIGIGITLLVRALLCNTCANITDPMLQSAALFIINIASVAVCLFIIFFFLLYWWSDRKWTSIKKRFRK